MLDRHAAPLNSEDSTLLRLGSLDYVIIILISIYSQA